LNERGDGIRGQPAAVGQMNGTVCLLLITAIMIIILHPQPNDHQGVRFNKKETFSG
jgi:hypothetical protein